MMKLKAFDTADFLDSDEAMVEYLNAALEEDDPKYFTKALGNVARAKGMSSISDGSGLGRQALYRAFPAKATLAWTRYSGSSTRWISGLQSPASPASAPSATPDTHGG